MTGGFSRQEGSDLRLEEIQGASEKPCPHSNVMSGE